MDVIANEKLNKDGAFTKGERVKYNLQGFMPDAVESIETQAKRELLNLRNLNDILQKYTYLQNLSKRNSILFYKLFTENIDLILPLLYTPGIEKVCSEYSRFVLPGSGIYITKNDKGMIHQIFKNWHSQDVKVIFLSDGEQVPGLGDMGINAMAYCKSVAQVHSAFGGLSTEYCLPVCLDIGTSNEFLLQDEFYCGIKEERAQQNIQEELLDEIINASKACFGKNVFYHIQGMDLYKASSLLERNQFNNILIEETRGTAAIVLAGILASLRIDGVSDKLNEHRIILYGSGREMAIANLLVMAKINENPNLSEEEARKNIWICDTRGLVHSGRSGLDKNQALYAHQFVEEGACFSFYYAVEEIRPTILVGCSGIKGDFSEDILEMLTSFANRPLVFTISNSEAKSECSPEEAYKSTGFNCIYVALYQSDPVENPEKHDFVYPSYGSAALLFSGLILGLMSSSTSTIASELFIEAALCLSNSVSDANLDKSILYPNWDDAREVTMNIAQAVANKAYELGIATNLPRPTDLTKSMLTYIQSYEYRTG